jgi:biopolymer transport protein ExbB/TolQ
MFYHSNKQEAFQAAQRNLIETQTLYEDIVKDSSNYGHQLKHLQQEINETFQQIENALEVASEHQKKQLEIFQNDLKSIVDEVNQI